MQMQEAGRISGKAEEFARNSFRAARTASKTHVISPLPLQNVQIEGNAERHAAYA